jgi:glucose-1-phosphate cytidylyltransferase
VFAEGEDMKVAILAGGLGSRISEETVSRPKPMVEIGGRPMLWHVMKLYSSRGFNHFVIAVGYKGEVIKRWFADQAELGGNLRIRMQDNRVEVTASDCEDWVVDVVETGPSTQTGGRIRRLQPYLGDERFMLTWGDGVSDVDLSALIAFHEGHGRMATLTAVRPPARYGHLQFEGDRIIEFTEKPQIGEGWVNGAFFVLEPGVFDYIAGDATVWEQEPLEGLAKDGELMAYRHSGFWQCMDTLRDRKLLESLWNDGDPPWTI